MGATKDNTGSSAGTFWGRVSPRTGLIIWLGLAVVLIAAVFFGITALSSPEDQSPITKLTPAEQSKLYYDQALTQQAQGNVDEALTLAEKAAKLDSGNAQAKSLVVKLRAAKARSVASTKPSTSATTPAGTPTSTPPPPVTTVFDRPTKDITVFLPVKIDGWSLAAPVGVGADGTVAAEPAEGNSAARPVTRALLAVHDRQTPAGAQAFVDKSIKQAYPSSGSAVVVAGAPGYFGTDGARLAAIGFTRGRYAFEVVLTIPAGSPESFQAAAEGLASSFPTKF